MELKVDYYTLGSEALDRLEDIKDYLDASGLDPVLLELVKVRASQLNGCAHCTDRHTERALALGEKPRRLFVLPTWSSSGLFSARERAALSLTDAVTLIADGVPDEVYRTVRDEFSESELVALTVAIGTINVWNRLAVCFREPSVAE